MTSKVCGKCRETKPIDKFYKSRVRKDGLRCYCKSCDNAVNKQHYQTNRVDILDKHNRINHRECNYDTYQPQLHPYGIECRRSPDNKSILEVRSVVMMY